MNEYKNLRAFLIKRFLLTIAFVGINEYAVLYIVNRTFIPVVMSLFFHGESVEEVGIAGIIFAIISILVTLILELVKFLVPDGMKLTVNTLINALKSSVGTKILGSPKEFAKLNASQEVLLSVFFIAILIIILIPYAIGAYYFARKIIVEVKKIEEEDLAKQKEYEKSRNLMLSDIEDTEYELVQYA